MSTLTTTTVKCTTLKNQSDVEVYTCKAWACIENMAIAAGGNVSSLTDNGTGLATLNLTTSVADTKWVAAVTYSNAGDTYSERLIYVRASGLTSSAIPVGTAAGGTMGDVTFFHIMVFR